MSDTTTTPDGMTCPEDGCIGHLEASSRIYLDVIAAHVDQDGAVVLDDLEFAHLNDQLDGKPCNLEAEFRVSCTEGHDHDWSLGEGLRARIGAQPIGNADRTLGTRGGATADDGPGRPRAASVLHLRANHTTSGNPRRCFAVFAAGGAFLGAIDEGYEGEQALYAAYPEAREIWPVQVDVPVSEYKRFLRRIPTGDAAAIEQALQVQS